MSRAIAAVRLVAGVIAAVLGQFDRRDVTMLVGVILLGVGFAASPWPWLGQVGPGIVLIAAAFGLSLTRRTVP